MSSKKIIGLIDYWFQTGSEGVEWIFYEDGKSGWDALNMIEEGDHLKIFDENGGVLFDGVIVLDTKTGWMEYPLAPNSGYGQQCALRYWVHWIQKGWQPDDWARLFIRKWDKQLRAELVKKNG